MTTYTIGIFGQSFAQALLAPAASGVMKEEMARAGYTLDIVGHGVGGCAVLKENAPAGNPDAYLWDPDGGGPSGIPGPALNDMLDVIDNAPVKPTRVIIQIGEGDSVVTSPLVDVPRWVAAYKQVIWKIKQECNSSNPNSVAVFIDIIGRLLTTGSVPGVQLIREAQFQVIAETSVTFCFDKYDLELLGEDPQYPSDTANRHKTPMGNAEMGYRAIQRVLLSLGKPYRFGPRMTALSREDSETIRCTIYCETDFSKPAAPSHFAVRDGSGNLTHSPDLNFAWDGNDLLISKTGGLPAGDLLFPYGELNTLDRDGLMYDIRHIPLQSLKKEIPA